ncbi:MAG: helix-turn-helix domain-containing protein [Actinomycetes bacterium]
MTTTTAGAQRPPTRSDQASRKPPVAEAVLAALADRPGATAEQLAAATGLGRSTVTRALACLAADHRVTRSPGGREQGRRVADRWSLPQPAPSADKPISADEEPGAVRPTGDRAAEGRLGRGELRSLIAARLAAEPTAEFTPSRVAGLLGRSAGAVGNALTRMVEEGLAVQTSASPRRYRHAPTGEAQ